MSRFKKVPRGKFLLAAACLGLGVFGFKAGVLGTSTGPTESGFDRPASISFVDNDQPVAVEWSPPSAPRNPFLPYGSQAGQPESEQTQEPTETDPVSEADTDLDTESDESRPVG